MSRALVVVAVCVCTNLTSYNHKLCMYNNRVGKELFENGIVSDSYRFKIKPLYRMPIFSNFAFSCPNTERLLHRIITLPTHEGLREADIKKIIETVKNITL